MDYRSRNIIRIILVFVWIILFGMLLKRDYFIKSLDLREAQVAQKGREESFSGVYFQKERIGYVKNRLTPYEKGFRLSQEAFLLLNTKLGNRKKLLSTLIILNKFYEERKVMTFWL